MTQTPQTLSFNCDLSPVIIDQLLASDEQLLDYLDFINLSAGFHTGNPVSIAQGVSLAKQHQVGIGCLVSYHDLYGAGERSIPHTANELLQALNYQIGALIHMCQCQDVELSYIKAHGALFRDMMNDLDIFETVVQAVSYTDLPLVILARHDNSPYLDIADEYNVPLLLEAYCDRIYKYDGKLVSRTHKHSSHEKLDDIFYQAMQLANFGTVTTDKGQTLALAADSLSMKIDSTKHYQQALKIVKTLKQA